MSVEARKRRLAYGFGSLMLLAQLFVAWQFIDGCYAEYTLSADVPASEILDRLDWLKAALLHHRWMIGYAAITLGLLLVIAVGLLVAAILRSKRHETETP